jgi:putative peptidoglycan lipid II flippase
MSDEGPPLAAAGGSSGRSMRDSSSGRIMRDGSPSKMLRDGGKLSLLTMCSRVLGLLREMTKAAFMGTGALAEAFTVSFMIPNFLRRLFAEGSITVAFIPTFSGLLAEKDEEKTREFLSASFTVLTLFVLATVALGIACTPLVATLFSTDRGETILLTRLMFPFLALVSVAALLQGILNSVGVFVPSGIGPILFNVCFIAVPYLIGGWTANPARAMAIGVLAGGLAQALCQLPAVLRSGFSFGFISLGRALRNPGMRRVFALIAPTILGMAAYQLNDLVCTSLASKVGAAAGIQYSIRLQELILGIFAVSAGTVLLPHLTEAANRADWPVFSAALGRVMKTIVLVTLPVALFSMVAGKEIIVLLFKARAFDEVSVELTKSVFFFHMTGLAFIALNRVIAPAFYARSDTKTPTFAGLLSFGVNIVLAAAFVGPFRGPGIALALSLASALNTVYLLVALAKSGISGIGSELGRTLRYFAKILIFSALAASALYFLRPLVVPVFAFSPSRLVYAGLPLVAETLIFGLIGVGFLAISRDEVAASFAARFARRKSPVDRSKGKY